MQINSQTKLNMVIGYPLKETDSPALHQVIYQQLHCNAVLLPFAHPQLSALVQTIKTLSVELTAVTMPFKQAVLAYVDEISEEVAIIQAANTLLYRDNHLTAYNTDYHGIAYALRDYPLVNKKVLLIGAGGAAYAAAYYLQQQQATIFYYNRTTERALRLSTCFGGQVISQPMLTTIPFEVIINATPVGRLPKQSPLVEYPFTAHQLVFDMIPKETCLLQQAKQQGAQIMTGLEMLIGQGCQQIARWLNQSVCPTYFAAVIKQALS